MGSRWDVSGSGLRVGLREETRYVFVLGFDRRAMWIAAAAPLVATLIMLSAL